MRAPVRAMRALIRLRSGCSSSAATTSSSAWRGGEPKAQ